MVNVYSTSGEKKKQIQLPKVFETEYRPDMIRRAFDALKANLRQPNGVDPSAGLKTSADYFGSRRRSYRQTINRAMTRLPRIKPGGGGLGRVRRVPQSVGGRQSHPPNVEKKLGRKINKQEYRFAINSAIAATVNKKLVKERNHQIKEIKEYPLIVEDEIQKISKAKDLVNIIKSLGLSKELESNKNNKILIAVGEDEGIQKAANNIPGIHAVQINELDLDLLAPGAQAGMLTIWSEQAITKVGEVSA